MGGNQNINWSSVFGCKLVDSGCSLCWIYLMMSQVEDEVLIWKCKLVDSGSSLNLFVELLTMMMSQVSQMEFFSSWWCDLIVALPVSLCTCRPGYIFNYNCIPDLRMHGNHVAFQILWVWRLSVWISLLVECVCDFFFTYYPL